MISTQFHRVMALDCEFATLLSSFSSSRGFLSSPEVGEAGGGVGVGGTVAAAALGGWRMRRGKVRNGLLPNSLRIISSCLKTVSSNAGSVASTVRSAGASVAASISVHAENEKDQVLWAGFDKLEIGSSFRRVLLLGYDNGFQVLDVDDASNVHELVSKCDGPVTFLQMQPVPAQSEGSEGFRASHPLLLVVASDETNGSGMVQGGRLSALVREHSNDPHVDCISMPTVVRFFSLRSQSYVHILRFRSAVYIVRCSRRIVAVALAAQIYCFDAVTLENKFSVLTYPMQGPVGINVGLGPLAVGPRWLAYASNNPLLSNTGRLSPQNLTPSPGVSPSTSPSSGSLVARYAMESSKQLAAGIISLGDMGYKTLSKYCQDLLPDGSNSPTSTHLSRKTSRLASPTHANEVDNAGMVVIKDLMSKEVISQFRAHTSPISALCFDPSGTLLVTTSVHGNNINVFRIMPARMTNGPSSASYDWTSSHIHLYKLYRGITTAVIQDICFSHYSQWVAIVSSHGTCHIFVLSPFGGSTGLQVQNFHSDGPVLSPTLSLPWWSTSTFMKDQQFLLPPTITHSVVGRIKNGNSGWLTSVSNIAASAGGKIPTPSGAVAAVFHNSVHHNSQPFHLKAKALENLLVYAPSGHVIQHELLPNAISESCESNSRLVSGPLQDDELRVTAEPVQWWDVCRRLNWSEREECIAHRTCGMQETNEMVADSSDCEDFETKSLNSSPKSRVSKDFAKANEKSHWYFSNAEVQVNSGRIPIWQKAKIHFYMMVLHSSEELTSDCGSGEKEIEKLSVNEVEIRRKDLMPVFDHHRELIARRCLNRSAPKSLQHGEKYLGTTVNRHPKTVSGGCSDDGSGDLLDSEDICSVRQSETYAPHSVEMASPRISALSTIMVTPDVEKMQEENMNCTLSPFQNDFTGSFLSYAGAPLIKVDQSVNGAPSNGAAIVSDSSTNVQDAESPADSHDMQEFSGYFHDGYCEVSELNGCIGTVEVATDADSSSSHCDKEKPEGDADGDDLLGGVFAFSEEG